MIVYTFETIFFPFDRAVNWLQELLEQQIIIEPVLLQHGATSAAKLSHPLLTSVVSLTSTEMQQSVRQASLVISHAGQGSARMLADMGACFILLPRLKRYGEHIDDHQLLFARTVEKYGVNYCTEFERLIKHVRQRPLPFQGRLLNGPLLTEHLITRYSNLQVLKEVQSLKLR